MNNMIKTLKSIEAQNNTVFNGRTEDRGLVFQFTFDSLRKFQAAEKEVEATEGYNAFVAAWHQTGTGIITAKFKFNKA